MAFVAGIAVFAFAQGGSSAGRDVPVHRVETNETVALPGPFPDSGNRFALLIGVMGYPALRPRDHLAGPGNDIALVAEYLGTAPGMGGADISILLDDGVHAPATLAAIRAEMADLAAATGPGDFVYIHFSGHGTQAPAPPGSDEPDGLDEVFLPYDVGGWNGGTGRVENGLIDDEIGAMLDAIRATGADVFAVFDACNSGTVTRGPDGVQLRRVEPAVLGIPVLDIPVLSSALILAEAEAPFDVVESQASQIAAPRGSLTAFFAARADQSTPEMNLPRGAPDRQPHGVFTYTVLEELAARPGQTYADLGAAVLARYATDGLAPGTQPLFEGALDASALRAPLTGAAAAETSWPVTLAGSVARVPAGSLHGLTVGDTLEVRDGRDGGILGQIQLNDIAPLTASGSLLTGLSSLPADAVVVAGPARISARIDLALPDPGILPLPATLALLDALAMADPALAGRLDPLPYGSEADLRLVIEAGRIAVIPGGGIGNTPLSSGTAFPPLSVAFGSDLVAVARDLAPLLVLEARALLLTRAAGALPTALGGVTSTLFVDAGTGEPAARFDPAVVPTLRPGDIVSLAASNARENPVDIDVLYIAADRSIQHIRQFRVLTGVAMTEPLFRVLPEGYGQELILIVQRDVSDDAPREPLTFLATGAVRQTLRTVGTTTGPPLSRYLAEAGLGAALRSPTLDAPGAAAIAIIPVQTLPN